MSKDSCAQLLRAFISIQQDNSVLRWNLRPYSKCLIESCGWPIVPRSHWLQKNNNNNNWLMGFKVRKDSFFKESQGNTQPMVSWGNRVRNDENDMCLPLCSVNIKEEKYSNRSHCGRGAHLKESKREYS